MEKTLKLGDKEYRLHSSLFTIIDYRSVFSTELFSDIKKLEKSADKKEDDLSTVIDTIFRIIYVLHRPFSKLSYNDFLMSLDFSLLSNQNELENLTNTIGEMLGTFQQGTTPQQGIKSKWYKHNSKYHLQPCSFRYFHWRYKKLWFGYILWYCRTWNECDQWKRINKTSNSERYR